MKLFGLLALAVATAKASITHAVAATDELPFTITSIDSSVAPSAENYNCLTKELWSEEKRRWCCTNKQLGCPPQLEPTTCEECVREGRSWQVGRCNPKVEQGSGCIVADAGCFASTSPSPSAADAQEVCQPWLDETAAKPLCGSSAAGSSCGACVDAHRLCGWHEASGECMTAPLYFLGGLKRSQEECAEGVPEVKVSAAHVADVVIEKVGGSAELVNLRSAHAVLLEAAEIVAKQLAAAQAKEDRKQERADKKAKREARKQERADKKAKREARKQERADKKAKKEARQEKRAGKKQEQVEGNRSLRSQSQPKDMEERTLNSMLGLLGLV